MADNDETGAAKTSALGATPETTDATEKKPGVHRADMGEGIPTPPIPTATDAENKAKK
jgi:hypothetical protein